MGRIHSDKITQRPAFIEYDSDATIKRLSVRHDVVELKYDGIWGRAEIQGDTCIVYSRNGQEKARWVIEDYKARLGDELHVLHGEFIFGSNWGYQEGLNGKFIVFDCTVSQGIDITKQPLNYRRGQAQNTVHGLDTSDGDKCEDNRSCERAHCHILMGEQWPVEETKELWKDWVVGKGYEGLMLKDSNAAFGKEWGRMKRSFEVDYVCMGFNYSNAEKYKGRMVSSVKGGLVVKGKFEIVCNVSGLNEDQRAEFYKYPDRFIGRVFRAKGKRIFPSGGLRHPNFNGWHPDKKADECIKNK